MQKDRDVTCPEPNEDSVIHENKVAHDEEAQYYDIFQYYMKLDIHNYCVSKEIEIMVNGLNKQERKSYFILDLGCGTGFTVSKLYQNDNFKIDAVDISEKMIEMMKKKINNSPNVTIFPMEVRKFLEYAGSENKKYDLIIFSTVLHHLYDYEAILKMSLPLINQDGYLYILNEPFGKMNFVEMVDAFLHRLLRCRKNLHYSMLNVLFKNKKFFFGTYDKALAEYHFYRGGIDLNCIWNLCRENNIEIIKERRYVLSNFRTTYNLAQRFKQLNTHIALIGKKK